MAKKENKNTLTVSKKEMLAEHEHLLRVLSTGSRSDRLREYLKQKKELKEYK